jgi:hypothetical protein
MGRVRREVPTSGIDVAIAKRGMNKSAVVPVGAGSEVFIKPHGAGKAGTGGRIVVRGEHVKPSHKLGTKAKGLKGCAGKRGSDFKACVVSALGAAPRSLKNY